MRWGMRGLALAALLLGVFAVGASLRDRGERSPVAAAPATTTERWWRTPFPPAAVAQYNPPVVVAPDPADILPDLYCGSVDGGSLSPGEGLFLWGWAQDPRTSSPAAAVLLLDNGRPLAPAVHVFRERPDVAAFKKEPGLIASGWNLWIPIDRLAAGEHVFEGFALLDGQKLGRLGGQVKIQIPGEP